MVFLDKFTATYMLKLCLRLSAADELETKGVIPGGVNVPTPEFAAAFSTMDPAEFKKRFGIERPSPSEDVVLYCQVGKRSMEAARYLARHGYSHVKNYSGLNDWTANNK